MPSLAPAAGEESPAANMLLPGEVFVLIVSKQRPHQQSTQYLLRVSETGVIEVPGTNEFCQIAGPIHLAEQKVLEVLQEHHRGYADAMGMEVEVKRAEPQSPTPVLSQPTPSPQSSVATNWPVPVPAVAQTLPQPDPRSPLEVVIEELREKNIALEKEIEALKQQFAAQDAEE